MLFTTDWDKEIPDEAEEGKGEENASADSDSTAADSVRDRDKVDVYEETEGVEEEPEVVSCFLCYVQCCDVMHCSVT